MLKKSPRTLKSYHQISKILKNKISKLTILKKINLMKNMTLSKKSAKGSLEKYFQ